MKVLITGIAGFLGSHLADAFLGRGDAVIGIDNLVGGDVENVPAAAEFFRVDCNARERVAEIMDGVDLVYHLAATAHEGHSVFSPHVNATHGYLASCSVFAAACQARVKRIVFTTSMARYGTQERVPFTEDMTTRPQDPYGIGKVAAEEVLRVLGKVHGIPWTIVCPHNIYGRRQRYYDPFRNVAAIMMNRCLQGKPPVIYGDGRQKRCFSHVSDAVAPLVVAGTSTDTIGEVINVGPDDEFVEINDLACMIADITGRPREFVRVGDRPQEVKEANCSADKARRLLGYRPRVRLADGLRDMVQWMKACGPRAFDYHLDLEIDNGKVPRTWKERLF